MFCKYNTEDNKILVSNGKSLIINSDKIKRYYRYPLDKTPLNIILVSQIKIDTRLTQKTPQILKRNVLDTIKKYQQTSLNEFTETFRISQLSRAIDDTDASILGNDSSISLKKELFLSFFVPYAVCSFYEVYTLIKFLNKKM